METDLNACLRVLNNGGLILYPTDTIWGIGCDATNEEAVSKIYVLKQRDERKSMIILLAEEKDIQQYTNGTSETIFSYLKQASKPTTIIYEQARNLAGNLINEDGSIGIRLVKDPFCNALVKAFGKPIVSTSANISGGVTPAGYNGIDARIKNGVDYIVQHRQDDTTTAIPSTIVKIIDGEIVILRP